MIAMADLLQWAPLVLSAVSVALLFLVLKSMYGERKPDLEATLRDAFQVSRSDWSQQAREGREELARNVRDSGESIVRNVTEMQKAQQQNLNQVEQRIGKLIDSNEKRLERLRETLQQGITGLQTSNEDKLDQMRQTVDEKLQSTLKERLGESFKLVSDRLESVHRGLGEMQELATGVGDLKRVLTNVKVRGNWGEVQIDMILEQILTPEQYARNVRPKPDSDEVVEYAIRLPGPRGDEQPVWLPVDAKFPREAYERLQEASESGDGDGVATALKELRASILKAAKDIADKYVSPPYTTDFAILFLPTEGLYAEVWASGPSPSNSGRVKSGRCWGQ
jgi:DNA recombination protein RmuC